MVLIVRCCCCYDEPWERYRPFEGRHDTQHTTMDPTEQHAIAQSTLQPFVLPYAFACLGCVNLRMLCLIQLPVG